ncbi:MAG: hypothetical protein JKX85_14255 [Phycisphaeraceae bacterium]|nr:hypothetical protein [Phycisphaeraceae bacterium]
MRRTHGDQLILLVAFAGAATVVVCLLGTEVSLPNTVETIVSFWDVVLQRNP